jgi:hypothetical protein
MANSYSIIWCTFRWTTKLFFHLLDLTVLNSWILLLHVGLNIPTEISSSFWWGIWLKKLLKTKIPPQVWLEDQMWSQQMLCDSRAAITSTGQQNHPPNSVVVCVHFTARERAQCISATDLTCAYAWCLFHVLSYHYICKSPPLWIVCRDKTVIQGVKNLLQQPELCE